MTPGAASATKSNVRASGPMRPTSGTRRNSLRYSRRASSVFIAIASSRLSTARGLKSSDVTSRAAARAPLASISQTSVRCPARAARYPRAAATDVFPAPPFPVTKISSRSSSVIEAVTRRPKRQRGRNVSPRSRCADRCRRSRSRRRRSCHRHGDAPSPLVGEPQDLDGAAEGLGDGLLDGGALAVVDFEVELSRGLGHTDADIHGEQRTAQTAVAQSVSPCALDAAVTTSSVSADG